MLDEGMTLRSSPFNTPMTCHPEAKLRDLKCRTKNCMQGKDSSNMLNRIHSIQVSDTTEDDSSNAACPIKKQ